MQNHLYRIRSKVKFLISALLSMFLLTLCTQLYAQTPPAKEWDKTFGGSGSDVVNVVLSTPDGGYLLGGVSASGISYDKTEASRGEADFWIVKTDTNGNKLWDKTYGGNGIYGESLGAIVKTPDGGYLLGGTSMSNSSGDKSENSRGDNDFWIVKIDKNGNKLWDRTYGGNRGDDLKSILVVADGGYILGGSSYSGISGEKTEANQGDEDAWIVRIDENGNKLWDRTFGGSLIDRTISINSTTDNHYLINGMTTNGVDEGGNEEQTFDYWIIKITKDGEKVWEKSYGVESSIMNVFPTNDEGYLLFGNTWNENIGSKFIVVKIDKNGNKVWSRLYGGNAGDLLKTVIRTADNNYLLGGTSTSGISGDKSEPNKGERDCWIIKIDENGNKLWDKTLGGESLDYLVFSNSLLETKDGGLLLAANSHSGISGDKTEANKGRADYWLVKMTPEGVQPSSQVKSFTLINADTDQDIREIKAGEVIDIATLPTLNLNIRANTIPATVKKVVFNLNGRAITENYYPYAIGGDNKGNYKPWQLPLGKNAITAIPYTLQEGSLVAGQALNLSFTVTGFAVKSLTLVNADTDQDIREIANGDVIDYSALGTKNINIRANTYPSTVGSVVFNLNGKVLRPESIVPYALGGDNYPTISDYKAYPLAIGSYTLKATPYSEKYAKGTTGTALAVNFTVTNGTTTREGQQTVQAGIAAYPNPFTDRVTLQAAEGSGKVRIEVVDAVGKLQHKAEIKLQSGKAEVALPADLPAGAYFMLVVAEGKDPQVVKLLKQ